MLYKFQVAWILLLHVSSSILSIVVVCDILIATAQLLQKRIDLCSVKYIAETRIANKSNISLKFPEAEEASPSNH
jgi:hypothetical protein